MLEWLATYGQGLGAILTVIIMVGGFWLKSHLKLNRIDTIVQEIKDNDIPHLERQTANLFTHLNKINGRLVRVETLLEALTKGLRQNGINIPQE